MKRFFLLKWAFLLPLFALAQPSNDYCDTPILLTDVTAPDSGNFTVYPGSHMRPIPDDRVLTPHSPGCVQLLGSAGDCYLFSHALWHGPSANYSGRARKTLLYNYCQQFVRWYDFAAVPAVLERATARQRRLLGALGHAFRPGDFCYAPTDQLQVICGEG